MSRRISEEEREIFEKTIEKYGYDLTSLAKKICNRPNHYDNQYSITNYLKQILQGGRGISFSLAQEVYEICGEDSDISFILEQKKAPRIRKPKQPHDPWMKVFYNHSRRVEELYQSSSADNRIRIIVALEDILA